MAVTGKTGADAIFKAIKRVCIVLSHYSAKLSLVITAAVVADVITDEEATIIRSFLSTANDLCAALTKLADYSGF